MKFKQSAEQKVYFWGCTHVFHDPKWPIPLWKSRGYDSVNDHANSLREKINTTCRNTDILIHLGDGFLNSTPEQVEEFLGTLNPTIYYFWGNHESSMSKLYRKYKALLFPEVGEADIYPLRYKNIVFMGYYSELIISGKFVICQHFPLKVWNNSKDGAVHIHSHNHGGLVSSLPDAQEGKIIDVGVEVFPNGPVAADDLFAILDKKNIKKVDKHH